MIYLYSVLEPEQRAIQDGRIGSESVLVDLSSQCGTMKIDMRYLRNEVHHFLKLNLYLVVIFRVS